MSGESAIENAMVAQAAGKNLRAESRLIMAPPLRERPKTHAARVGALAMTLLSPMPNTITLLFATVKQSLTPAFVDVSVKREGQNLPSTAGLVFTLKKDLPQKQNTPDAPENAPQPPALDFALYGAGRQYRVGPQWSSRKGVRSDVVPEVPDPSFAGRLAASAEKAKNSPER